MSRAKNQMGRRGAAMVTALVVVLVVTVITATMMQSLLRSFRETRRAEWELQAEYLADSALARALARLRKDPAYAGETWSTDLAARSTPVDEDPAEKSRHRGVATIKVEMAPRTAGHALVTVEAHFPDDSVQRVLATRETVITLSLAGETP